jgi:hypothetical protein
MDSCTSAWADDYYTKNVTNTIFVYHILIAKRDVNSYQIAIPGAGRPDFDA